jgi:phosphate uptake regulator
MLDEAVEALITEDKRLAEDAVKREDDADMMYWLIVRLLLSAQLDDGLVEKLGMKSKLEIAGYRLISKELESVADHGEEIARTVMELIDSKVEVPTSLVKSLKDLADGVREMYSRGIAALLSRDLKVASETVSLRNELGKKEEKFTKQLFDQTDDSQVQMRFRTIVHGIERMSEYATSIAVIAINRYLERPTNICHPAST